LLDYSIGDGDDGSSSLEEEVRQGGEEKPCRLDDGGEFDELWVALQVLGREKMNSQRLRGL